MLPFIEIFGGRVYFYPLILGIIWGLSYRLFNSFVEKKRIYFPRVKFFFICLFLVSWFFSKVSFYLSSFGQVTSNLIFETSFWLGGGLVFYGGFIGAALFFYLYVKYYKLEFTQFSFVPIILSFGHALGRFGCFLAGCCYGDHCDLPWAVYLHGDSRHPVQLYESLGLFLLSGILYRLYKNNKSSFIIWTYILSYAVLRFALEFFRGDELRGKFALFSTSQWISLSIVLIFISVKGKKIYCFLKNKIH